MLEDSQAGLIVTNTANLELAPRIVRAQRIASTSISWMKLLVPTILPADPAGQSRRPYSTPRVPLATTEGCRPYSPQSTPHRNGEYQSGASSCRQDKLTLLHSVGFGSAQAHAFQSLLNGGSLSILSDVNKAGIPHLAKWLRDEWISVYHSPPAVFRELAAGYRGAGEAAPLAVDPSYR